MIDSVADDCKAVTAVPADSVELELEEFTTFVSDEAELVGFATFVSDEVECCKSVLIASPSGKY